MRDQHNPRARRVYERESEEVRMEIDGELIPGYAGESVAAGMLVNGFTNSRWTPWERRPRSVFCGMGACFDCVIFVDGVGSVRSCMTPSCDEVSARRPGDRKTDET